jgi:predicted MFS family arabinose efflux permease
VTNPALARRQIGLLVVCQALLYTNNVTLIAVNGLAGLALAPSPLLATLPITSYVIGATLTTVPASLAMGRWGRRRGFMFGAAMGVAGTLLGVVALLLQSFVLLCAATLVIGGYNAFSQYFRFAAADVAEAYAPELKERAIAWVLAAGLAGGIVGSEVSKLTRTALPAEFAGTYVALSLFALLSAFVASRLVLPPPKNAGGGAARPLAQIARQPAFIVAVGVAAISFGAMNLLMTATPLAMKVCGFGYPDSTDVIKWHVIAMFAPGFVTGSLLRRYGTPQVMLAGCALMLVAIVIAHAGLSYWHFWLALTTLGVGWNFMFTGATTLLTTTYRPAEKAKVQGVNDLTVFLAMMTSSASSGALVAGTGWTDLNLYATPFVLLAVAGLVYLLLYARGRAAVA